MLPYTWEEMRATFEPTMPREDCPICRTFPSQSRNHPAWTQLEPIGHTREYGRFRCPSCHQQYNRGHEIPYDSADPYNPELTGEPYDSLDLIPLSWGFPEMIIPRVADERFGRALAALEPTLAVDQRNFLEGGPRFPRDQVIRVACGDERRWLVLSDEGELTHCTLPALAQLWAPNPPKLDDPDRVRNHAITCDHLTTDHWVPISSFDDIRWRDELTDAERAYIEELRRISTVEPERIEVIGDRTLVHRWLISHHRLICRVLTVLRTGEVVREDAVIGELLPTIYVP